jgi:DNA-binding NarL/FixJ family response regulator
MSDSLDERSAVLVDQHPLWLETVEQVLRRADVTVLAKITSAASAIERIGDLRPDMLVTGLKMPDGQIDGFALLRQAREQLPTLKAIVFSMYDDGAHIDAAFTAGADAYVLKTASPDELVSATHQAFSHSVYLAGSRHAPLAVVAPLHQAPYLTRREHEILQLVAEGHSNAQLARMLWVTEQTVKFHLSNIYRKLDVSNRTEASRWAQLQGLLGDEPRVMLAAG